jgi:hypothetical protein
MRFHLFILLLPVLQLRSQTMAVPKKPLTEPQQVGFIELGGGWAIPMGDFGEKDANNDKSGFAVTGYNLNVTGGVKLTEKFGVMAMFTYQNNPFDEKDLASQLKSPLLTITVEATSGWEQKYYMGGVYVSLPTNEKNDMLIDLRFAGGPCWISSPAIKLNAYGNAYFDYVNQEAGEAQAFALTLSAGIIKKVTDNVGFSIRAGYLGLASSAGFRDVKVSSSSGSDSFSFNQDIGTFNLGAGLLIHF